MRHLLKGAVVVAPVLTLILLLRLCSGTEAERWRARVARHDPAARVTYESDDLIVIAPDRGWGQRTGERFRLFRNELILNQSDILGTGSDRRTVVVLFSGMDALQAYFGERNPMRTRGAARPEGWHDPVVGAIFLPPRSDFRTLRHETVHLLMAQARGPGVVYSPWVKEGLAQLFEIYEPGTDPPCPPGVGSEGRVLAPGVRARGLDVTRLLSIQDYAEFVTEDIDRNYLEALLLTAFLYERRPREVLVEYMAAERETSGSAARLLAFRRLYQHDREPFRADLDRFLARLGSPR